MKLTFCFFCIETLLLCGSLLDNIFLLYLAHNWIIFFMLCNSILFNNKIYIININNIYIYYNSFLLNN